MFLFSIRFAFVLQTLSLSLFNFILYILSLCSISLQLCFDFELFLLSVRKFVNILDLNIWAENVF